MPAVDILMDKILADMLEIDGVLGAVIVDKDGLVIESALKKKLDKEAIAGVLNELTKAIALIGEQFEAGNLSSAIIEYTNAKAFVNPITEGYYLVIIGDSDLNLGRMKLELRKVLPKLSNALS